MAANWPRLMAVHERALETPSIIPLLAVTEPIDHIHDYGMPIPHYKHPPVKDDFQKPFSRRNRKPRIDRQDNRNDKPDGHIDDFA